MKNWRKWAVPAVTVLTVAFAGCALDYWVITPGQQGWISYLACAPLAVGVTGLVVSGFVNLRDDR